MCKSRCGVGRGGPSDFIRDYRLKHAFDLLESGKHRVADVAYAVGFQDVAYFSKTFKRTFGRSPSVIKKEEA